jgi:hypothetical protein
MQIRCFLFGLTLLAVTAAQAQTTVTLRGQVTDESGALVPGAKIAVAGPQGVNRSVNADGQGQYVLTGLPAGSYSVAGSAADLATPSPVQIALNKGTVRLDLQLRIKALHDTVKVEESSGPSLSTDAASNSNGLVLRGQDLSALSDDPNDLQADLQALAGPAAGPNGGAIYVDGFAGGELPAKNAIREVRINQNPFSPEFDKLGYGRIEIFTKPGSAKYHATVDYNLGTDVWNSRNPYSAQKAPFLLNEFEGNAGGPLGKRASFTVDAQRNMVDNGFVISAVTLDPNTLSAAPYQGVFKTPQTFTRVSPRVDYQLSENNTLVMRYGITRIDINGGGIGGFDLASRGYHGQFTNQTVQLADTAVLGTVVNETRFQFYRAAGQRIAISTSPELQVLGSFNNGGSLLGRSFDTLDTFELQNYTSMIRGTHSLRFGIRLTGQIDDNVSPQDFNGTFTFGGRLAPVLDANNQPVTSGGNPVLEQITSIERYRRTVLFQQLGYSAAQIRALGGGATQFTIAAGNPALSVHQYDAAAFFGDDWRVRPNLTLSLGMRYEVQTNIHDWRDVAPRLAFAWAPGGARMRRRTVLRAGFGMFYDRFPLTNTLTADRYNGAVQQQYVIANPDFYPTIPSISQLAPFESGQVIERVSSTLRAPYIMQSAVTVERQLLSNTTFALTYTNAHGLHILRSEDINAPLPGTYSANVPGSGVFPLGTSGPVFLMSSSGLYNQNQLIANVTTKLGRGVSLFSFYSLNKAMSNSDGIATFPANPYNYTGEYGPAATDVRHRLTFGGSISTVWNIRLSPFVIVQSGAPFDITAGSDLYGTTLFNGRPGIPTDLSKPGLIDTRYGLLDPNPTPDERLLSRNYGRGPALITVNLRITKAFGFGPLKDGATAANASRATGKGPVSAPAPGSFGGLPDNRGLRALLGSSASERRFNLIVGMSMRNLLNHTNPGPIIGDITSPLFGFANQTNVLPNGEGFSESANNRRLELQIRLTF